MTKLWDRQTGKADTRILDTEALHLGVPLGGRRRNQPGELEKSATSLPAVMWKEGCVAGPASHTTC